jgi:HlyD family secretion protein
MRQVARYVLLIWSGAALLLAGCSPKEVRSFEGLAAGDYLQVTVPLSGSLASLNVKPGERVQPGEALFALDVKEVVAASRSARSRIVAAQRQLEAANASGKPEQIEAAQSAVNVAESELAEAGWRLEQTKAKAPQEALVVDTLYSEGQWVPAGSAVVALVAPEAMKVRFFVPEHVVGTLRYGQRVSMRCDGCKGGIRAEITYVSPIAETDAVGSIAGQSPGPRFLVEVTPQRDAAAVLRPGNPVQVLL